MPDLTLVDCARVKLRLTAPACARFWMAFNPVAPPTWVGRVACHLCPAGAARAGVRLDGMQAHRNALANICTRCQRLSDRIIGADALCISCYNRAREVRVGINGKGAPPRFVARGLFPAAVVAIEGGGSVERIDRPRSRGPLELVLQRARRARHPIAFGWAPPIKEAA